MGHFCTHNTCKEKNNSNFTVHTFKNNSDRIMYVTENATAIDDKLVYIRSSAAIVLLRPVKHKTTASGQTQ
jgi:hypothetical protein